MALRRDITLFSGIFLVMALSNAIVPVLSAYAPGASLAGLVYACYFLGAFLATLPSGMLADRFTQVPVIRAGLVISILSGIILAMTADPAIAAAARLIEGIGAGLFVAAALSAVNSDPGHVRLSGWFMASQNAGLVTGLVVAGFLAAGGRPAAGIALFTLLAALPAAASFLLRNTAGGPDPRPVFAVVPLVGEYRWIWYSAVVLIGVTGVVTALYPAYSGAPPEILSIWIAGMSVATIAAVLVFSRMPLVPGRSIQISAILMAGGIVLAYFSPAGFLVIGALAGVVMIAQMAYLAGVREQGTVMGLYATFSYLGMTIMPAVAGFIAGGLGFPTAFAFTAAAVLSVTAAAAATKPEICQR